MQRFDYDKLYGDVLEYQPSSHLQNNNECKNGVCPIKRNIHNRPQFSLPHGHKQYDTQQNHQQQHQQYSPQQNHQQYSPQQNHQQYKNRQTQQQYNIQPNIQKTYHNPQQQSGNEITHPYFKQSNVGGHNTRNKKSEVSQHPRTFEPNHTHPNHIKSNGNDPFHGLNENHYTNQKLIRNQNIQKYQMEPRRTMIDMNQNPQNMYNSHNEQIKQNEFTQFASSHNLEPSYYDQSNYSGLDLEADRMFLADAKEVSDQYASAAVMSGKNIQFVNNSSMVIPPSQSEDSTQVKQRRSYRNPNEEVDSNNKIWEYQFTPMTIPL